MEIKEPVTTEPVVTETAKVENPVTAPEQIVEEKKEEPVAVVETPEPPKSEPVVTPKEVVAPPYRKEMDTKLSHEERILAYLESRSGFVKINDFLKSLYPIPKQNSPVAWMDQGNMKRLRVLIEKMQAEGKIEISANSHDKLGRPYYPDDTTLKTAYYHLGTVVIECAKK